MRRLYEIDVQMARLLDIDDGLAIDPETGEVLDAAAQDDLALERNQKIENCLLVVKNDKAEAEMLDREIKRLQARKKTLERHAEWLKEYVSHSLNGAKFKGDLVSSFFRTSKSVNILDIDSVPEEYLKMTVEPVKTEIMNAYKNGVDISGFATIEEKQNLIIH